MHLEKKTPVFFCAETFFLLRFFTSSFVTDMISYQRDFVSFNSSVINYAMVWIPPDISFDYWRYHDPLSPVTTIIHFNATFRKRTIPKTFHYLLGVLFH